MKSYIEIIRPANAVMASIAVLLMAVIGHTYSIAILVGAVSVFVATGGGNVINDYFDYEIDKVNKPYRPIPSGRIRREQALYYALVLFLVAIVLGFMISVANGLTVIVCSVIMIVYAYDFKQRCLIGNLTVSLLTGLTFIYGGLITGDYILSTILGFFAFLMTLSREIVKDAEDVEGDLVENASTFPIVYGVDRAVLVAFILNVITCILSPILYVTGIFNVYYLVIVLFADVIFTYSGLLATRDMSSGNLHRVSKYMKIGMLVAFIAFAVGSI